MEQNNKGNIEKTENAKKIADKSNKFSTNLSIFEDYFAKFFRALSSFIDSFIFSSRFLWLSSLVLALIIYFLVSVDVNSFMKSLSSSKTLNNVNVVTRYNSESFEVSGAPTSCNVIISGDAANVNNSTANKNGYCLIDLEGYTEGTHYVNVSAYGYGDNVSASSIPSNAEITLKRKTTSQFKLSYDYINSNLLDAKYILSDPVFNDGVDYVNIRASQDTLNSIALVKALIDVKGQTADFTVDAPLVAYNSRGQQVNAEIVPSTVKANVKISSFSKVVPIVLTTTGDIGNGLGIDTIEIDQQSTTIYGSSSVLEAIKEVPVVLDLSTISSNTSLMQPLSLPNGVTSSTITVVNIKVVVDTAVEREIENVVVSYKNNDKNYGAKDIDYTTIKVTIKGSESNISEITSDNIYAYIDIKDLDPGTYTLPLYLEKKNTSNFFTMTPTPATINITLLEEAN